MCKYVFVHPYTVPYGSKPQLAAVRRSLRVSVKKSVEKSRSVCAGYEVSGEWLKPIRSQNPTPGIRATSTYYCEDCDCDWESVTAVTDSLLL